MGLFKDFVSQTRKPEGVLGKMMLGGMNSGHAKMADWGFDHLPAIAPAKAVDLGCGGGPTLVGLVSDASGGNLKLGILAGIVFPVVLAVCLFGRKNREIQK